MKLGELWGQSVIIDNRPGASGVIANAAVAKAPPDGYTMLLMSITFANLIATGKKTPYDPFGDLESVAQLAAVPNVLSVHPSLPVKSVKDLISTAKSRPGQINYGTGGTLTGPHLATELFKLLTKTDMLHVSYKGTPPAVIDLVAGRVQMMMALTPVVAPHLKANRLRAIAVSSSKRILSPLFSKLGCELDVLLEHFVVGLPASSRSLIEDVVSAYHDGIPLVLLPPS